MSNDTTPTANLDMLSPIDLYKHDKYKGEHGEQCKVFDWAEYLRRDYPELKLLFSVPNGGLRSDYERQKQKDAGLKSGVPDMMLPVARHGYHGLFIELKYGGNKPAYLQKVWIRKLIQQGYLAVACWGADEAIELLIDYLEIE